MVEDFAAMFGMDIFGFSIMLIIIAVIIIAISIIVNVFVTRKSGEEAVAGTILKNVKLIKTGKLKPKTQKEIKADEKVVKEEEKNAKDKGVSMKEHLSKKFKPKIEKQLNTKVDLIDFKGKGSDFHALVEVGGVKILLVLDSSGKIIDYKKK